MQTGAVSAPWESRILHWIQRSVHVLYDHAAPFHGDAEHCTTMYVYAQTCTYFVSLIWSIDHIFMYLFLREIYWTYVFV